MQFVGELPRLYQAVFGKHLHCIEEYSRDIARMLGINEEKLPLRSGFPSRRALLALESGLIWRRIDGCRSGILKQRWIIRCCRTHMNYGGSKQGGPMPCGARFATPNSRPAGLGKRRICNAKLGSAAASREPVFPDPNRRSCGERSVINRTVAAAPYVPICVARVQVIPAHGRTRCWKTMGRYIASAADGATAVAATQQAEPESVQDALARVVRTAPGRQSQKYLRSGRQRFWQVTAAQPAGCLKSCSFFFP